MGSKKDHIDAVGPERAADRMAELLAGHVDAGVDCPSASGLPAEDRAELASLLKIARSLDARMTPARPSPAFVQSLGRELVEEAARRARQRKKRHRVAVISAAVAGGIVSVASVVGGIVMLVKWLRTRGDARQPSTA